MLLLVRIASWYLVCFWPLRWPCVQTSSWIPFHDTSFKRLISPRHRVHTHEAKLVEFSKEGDVKSKFTISRLSSAALAFVTSARASASIHVAHFELSERVNAVAGNEGDR